MLIQECYNILEIPQNSSKEEIKKAYKKLALKYHPDKQNDKSEEEKTKAASNFKKIAEAYDMLMNPEKFNNNNNQSFRRSNIDPNELFKQFFNINIGTNQFSSRMNININGLNNTSSNCVMRTSSISIVNGKKIEKIRETINGITSEKIIVSDVNNNNNNRININ
jgi:molecular chaperone DnaJ